MDAWIAGHVMDYRLIKCGEAFICSPSGGIAFTFHPTTDPAAAMAVLEMCIKDRAVKIEDYGSGPVTIYIEQPDGRAVLITQGDTLPLAICRFARKLFEKGKE